jgi:hypothetical protein
MRRHASARRRKEKASPCLRLPLAFPFAIASGNRPFGATASGSRRDAFGIRSGFAFGSPSRTKASLGVATLLKEKGKEKGKIRLSLFFSSPFPLPFFSLSVLFSTLDKKGRGRS